jgi:hypothetical protein
MHNSRDKYKNNFDGMKSNYESKIKEGPIHICSCCGGLWFEYSIREYTVGLLTNKGLTLYPPMSTGVDICVSNAKN